MARDRANVRTDIWTDDDFRSQSGAAQLLYLQLFTSNTLSYAGVADWRPKRVAMLTAGRVADDVTLAAGELVRGLYIVIDEESEEVLVRSFLRHDGLMQKPNVAKAMVTAWERVYSKTIKGVIVHELCRLEAQHPEWRGFTVPAVRDMMRAVSIDPRETLPGTLSGTLPLRDAPLLTTNYSLLTTDSQQPPPAPRVTENDFENAYKHWPKKVERKDAHEQFVVAVKKRGLDQLTADIARFGSAYAAAVDKRYIPALGVWLRRERWTDELPQASTPISRGQENLAYVASLMAQEQEAIEA